MSTSPKGEPGRVRTTRCSSGRGRAPADAARRRRETRGRGPKARQAGYTTYEEADERRRLAAGEIDVDDLQRQADRSSRGAREVATIVRTVRATAGGDPGAAARPETAAAEGVDHKGGLAMAA